MYYGSGTVDKIARRQLCIRSSGRMQRAPGGRCVCTQQTAALIFLLLLLLLICVE